MFAHMIDDFKESAGIALRLTSLAALVVVALSIAIVFLGAAVFVLVLQTYGLIAACLVGAGIFLLVALIAGAFYRHGKKRAEARARAAENAKSGLGTTFADPMLITTGIQLIRTIGIKRLIPVLAIGGLALGFLASRQTPSADQAPAE
jgi:hypothetical protein